MVHWTTDTWAVAQSTAGALARAGAKRWFLITADYAFGHSVQRETTRVVQANGGQVVGSAVYPFPATTDFSSFLVSAAAARPDAVGFCNAGTDMINCAKQAQEFGLAGRRIRPAAMIAFIIDVHTLGLQSAQGLVLTESFYWDLNDRTRALHGRLRGKMANNHAINSVQAQGYSCAFHYLRAVAELGAARAKASGLEAIETMKRLPTDDDAHGPGSVRADGRKIHPTYLFEVKTPAESRAPWDYFKLIGDHAGRAGLPALGGRQLPLHRQILRLACTPEARCRTCGGAPRRSDQNGMSSSRSAPLGLSQPPLLLPPPPPEREPRSPPPVAAAARTATAALADIARRRRRRGRRAGSARRGTGRARSRSFRAPARPCRCICGSRASLRDRPCCPSGGISRRSRQAAR